MSAERVRNLVEACEEAMRIASAALERHVEQLRAPASAGEGESAKGEIDELVRQAEAEVDVGVDRVAASIDEIVERMPRERAAVVIAEIDRLVIAAEGDVRDVLARRALAEATLADWTKRATETTNALADEARERSREYAAALAAIDGELAEYRASVDDLARLRRVLGSR